jgi:hypothetical protein
MPKYIAKIYTRAEWAETEIRARNPKAATAMARQLFYERPEELYFDGYDSLSSLEEIRIQDAGGKDAANWLAPTLHLAFGAPKLVSAAKRVIAHWETGELDEAVRELSAAIEEIDKGS